MTKSLILAFFFAFLLPLAVVLPDVIEKKKVIVTNKNGVETWVTPDRLLWRNPDGTKKRKLYVGIQQKGITPDELFDDDLNAAMAAWNDAQDEWDLLPADADHPADIIVGVGDGMTEGGKALLGHTGFKMREGKDGKHTSRTVIDKAYIGIDNDGNPHDGKGGWEKPGDSQEEKDKKWNRVQVMTHELGHAIGLSHTKAPDAASRDTMWDGAGKDSKGEDLCGTGNDGVGLTDHDKKEAKEADKLCALDPVRTDPGFVQTGVPTMVSIYAGPGHDLLLDQALNIQLISHDPTRLQMNVMNVDNLQVHAMTFAAPGEGTDQGFDMTIAYPFGSETYAGLLQTGPVPVPSSGEGPNAGAGGPEVETLPCVKAVGAPPVKLDSSGSYHDIPNEYISSIWNVDGDQVGAEYLFLPRSLSPGVHHAHLVVQDRWGQQSVAEKTLIVGALTNKIHRLGRGGAFSSLLLANPGMSWCASHGDFLNGEVLFSFYDGTSVYTEVIAQAALDNHFTSLAKSPLTGEFSVAYYDHNLPGFYLATREAPGVWVTEQIPDTLGHDDGDFCQLAFDSLGRPQLVYFDYNSNEIRYALKNGSSWTAETVSSFTGTAPWVSIAVNDFDEPHLAWTNQSSVYYARKSPVGWRVQTVASDASTQTFTSCDLGLDADGEPVVVYMNTLGKVTLARWFGRSWAIESIMTVGAGPIELSMFVDRQNEAHIAYYKPGVPNQQMIYLTKRGEHWTEIVLDPNTGSPNEQAGTNIQLNSAHVPCVSYLGRNVNTGLFELRVVCTETCLKAIKGGSAIPIPP